MQTGSINADLGASHPAKKHADFLGDPVEKGCWVTINEDAPVQVLDLYAEGQFVYERDGRLVTYFCCCVKRVCPPNDLSGVMAEGAEHWAAAQRAVADIGLTEAIDGVGIGAALLLRVAAADESADARIAERWLRNMGLVGGLSKQAACAVADWQAGEGPRSGGGAATSGAGAQRKEGVQPPGDSASVMGARA